MSRAWSDSPKGKAYHRGYQNEYRKTPAGRRNKYKTGAKLRDLTWALTDAEAFALFAQPCHWCGAPGPGGIDRFDNDVGYESGNVVACCSVCNHAKATMSGEQFAAWVSRLSAHFARSAAHLANLIKESHAT